MPLPYVFFLCYAPLFITRCCRHMLPLLLPLPLRCRYVVAMLLTRFMPLSPLPCSISRYGCCY